MVLLTFPCKRARTSDWSQRHRHRSNAKTTSRQHKSPSCIWETSSKSLWRSFWRDCKEPEPPLRTAPWSGGRASPLTNYLGCARAVCLGWENTPGSTLGWQNTAQHAPLGWSASLGTNNAAKWSRCLLRKVCVVRFWWRRCIVGELDTASERRRQGLLWPISHQQSTGQTKVTKWAPIHCIISVNVYGRQTPLKNVPPPKKKKKTTTKNLQISTIRPSNLIYCGWKKNSPNIYDKAVQSNIPWLNLN